jgi:hypothetical protein
LEQALLGTRNFNDLDIEENNKNSAKLDAKEMEQLLREGAYAVLLEDDTEAIKEFCEQDIEKLLEQRAHVLVVEGTAKTDSWLNKRKKSGRTSKSLFTGESAMEHAEIDVNDPDFWKKVLPDLVTPDSMLERFKDLCKVQEHEDAEDDEDDGEENVDSKKEEEEVVEEKKLETDENTAVSSTKISDNTANIKNKSKTSKKNIDKSNNSNANNTELKSKFMKDLMQMMEGMLDLTYRQQLPERERQICLKLLLRLTLKENVFDEVDRDQAQEWFLLLLLFFIYNINIILFLLLLLFFFFFNIFIIFCYTYYSSLIILTKIFFIILIYFQNKLIKIIIKDDNNRRNTHSKRSSRVIQR